LLLVICFFFDPALVDDSRHSLVCSGSNEVEHVHHQAPTKVVTESTLSLPSYDDTSRGPVNFELEMLPPVENISISTPKPVAKSVETKVEGVENRIYKQYEVGAFKSIEGGTKNTLEITSCDVPVAQIKVRIEKSGSQLVFQRTIYENNAKKDQVQRFSIPYTITQDRVRVTYDRRKDGGTLIFLMTKPGSSTFGNTGTKSSSTFGQFCSFIVKGVPNKDGRISMASGQTSDAFIFTVTGESKYDTEVIGELLDGPEITMKYHCTTTVPEENTKKKATQSITLPMKISLENIHVEGTKITVYKKKPKKKFQNQRILIQPIH